MRPLMVLGAQFDWIEIPVSDIERAANFYGLLFETTLEVGEMVPGLRSSLLPMAANAASGIPVALMEGEGYVPAGFQGCRLYFQAVPTLEEFLSRVEEAGGSIEMPPLEIGTEKEKAFLSLFFDTEGNLMGAHSSE